MRTALVSYRRCSHCRVLAPTWEVLAKVMYDANDESMEEGGDEYGDHELYIAEGLDVPVVIAKVRIVLLSATKFKSENKSVGISNPSFSGFIYLTFVVPCVLAGGLRRTRWTLS